MKAKITERALPRYVPQADPYEVFDTDQRGLLLRIQPSGVRSYYFAYSTRDGRRRRLKLGEPGPLSVAAAREMARRAAGEVAEGGDPQGAKAAARTEAARREASTLRSFVEGDYKRVIVPQLKDGEAQLARLKACFGKLMDRPMMEITSWDLERWRAERRKEGKAASTINRDVNALRSCLRAGLKLKRSDPHPLADLKSLRVDKGQKPRAFTAEQRARLLAVARERDAERRAARKRANAWRRERGYELLPETPFGDYLLPMIEISLLTGLRRGELVALDWRAVNVKGKKLIVTGGTAKSQQTREIPLHARAVEIFTTLGPKADGPVFEGKDGEAITTIRTAWRALAKRAGVKLGWHSLRHTFATDLLNAGAALTIVKDLMGHAEIATTARYLWATEQQRKAAVEALA